MSYEIAWLVGDYRERQLWANKLGVVVYVEGHLNALAVDRPGLADNAPIVIVAGNASAKTLEFAKAYLEELQAVGLAAGAIRSTGPGTGNLRLTRMPAFLLEPAFCSEPSQAAWIRSEEGAQALGAALAASIRRSFPQGGKIAFSIGHKGKTSAPHDRGALLVGGGTEADNVERYMRHAAHLLGGAT